ncbi:MAG: hypothetical protein ACI8QT_001449 [Halioglobus sp.]
MATKRKHTPKTKKDRILQARIPEQLDEQLRDRAENLGLSVSSVVRNVLLHTFNLVEGVVSDSAQIARVIQGRPSAPTPDSANSHDASSVVGWQETILNRNGVCDQCNTILTKGEPAAVGLPIQARPILLCTNCLTDLAPTETTSNTSDTESA